MSYHQSDTHRQFAGQWWFKFYLYNINILFKNIFLFFMSSNSENLTKKILKKGQILTNPNVGCSGISNEARSLHSVKYLKSCLISKFWSGSSILDGEIVGWMVTCRVNGIRFVSLWVFYISESFFLILFIFFSKFYTQLGEQYCSFLCISHHPFRIWSNFGKLWIA